MRQKRLLCEKIPVKETYISEKKPVNRLINVQRDLQKRPIVVRGEMRHDIYVKGYHYLYEKRPVKETYMGALKRPAKETCSGARGDDARHLRQRISVCAKILLKETYICEKRPVNRPHLIGDLYTET